jgi:hypothetical protein
MVKQLSFQPTRKAVNVQVPVYANFYSDGSTGYSFYGTTTSSGAVIKYDFVNDAIASREFTDMAKDFQLIRVLGAKFRVVPTRTGTSNTTIDLTPVFFMPLIGSQTPSSTTAYISDQSMEVMINNLCAPKERYYTYPSVLLGSSGYPIGGSSVFLQPSTLSASANVNLLLGFATGPSSTSSNTIARIAVVDCILDVEFSAPFSL